jgi:RNA polymerase sigma-70 factor (ECF subfamily)
LKFIGGIIDGDDTIIRTVRTGDTEAFAQLVDRHKEQVYAILMRLTGDPQAAEELAHEAFVRAYRGLDGFRGEARFGTWITQIAINLARDRVRERRRNRTVSLEALLEQDADAAVFADKRSQYDPLAEVSERDMIMRFENALEELPASYREVFVLRHVQNMPYEEIAEITGDSIGSLKVRTHRARKLLKQAIFPDERSVAREDVTE